MLMGYNYEVKNKKKPNKCENVYFFIHTMLHPLAD